MSRRPARFTEADLRRAAKVAKELGMAVEAYPDGMIRMVETDRSMNVPPSTRFESDKRIVL